MEFATAGPRLVGQPEVVTGSSFKGWRSLPLNKDITAPDDPHPCPVFVLSPPSVRCPGFSFSPTKINHGLAASARGVLTFLACLADPAHRRTQWKRTSG
jgi:hypothetical protein